MQIPTYLFIPILFIIILYQQGARWKLFHMFPAIKSQLPVEVKTYIFGHVLEDTHTYPPLLTHTHTC